MSPSTASFRGRMFGTNGISNNSRVNIFLRWYSRDSKWRRRFFFSSSTHRVHVGHSLSGSRINSSSSARLAEFTDLTSIARFKYLHCTQEFPSSRPIIHYQNDLLHKLANYSRCYLAPRLDFVMLSLFFVWVFVFTFRLRHGQKARNISMNEILTK